MMIDKKQLLKTFSITQSMCRIYLWGQLVLTFRLYCYKDPTEQNYSENLSRCIFLSDF